jgi:hypothetical protein
MTGAPAVPTLTASAVAIPVPKPETPVEIGKPVAFVKTPEAGVPSAGVTSVGLSANTRAPVPVSPVTAAAKFALDGVAKNVATPVPKPETPVEIGNPVALVNVAENGVPNTGVTNVGLLDNTLLPEPVLVTLTTFLLASKAKAVEAVKPDNVVVPLTVTLVNDAAPLVLLTLIKSDPFQATRADSPLIMVTPVVGPAPTNLILWVLELALITV